MNKRHSALILLSIFALALPAQVFAYDKVSNYQDFTAWYQKKLDKETVPFVSAAVIEAETFEPLYFHSENRIMPTASLAKLITAGVLNLYPLDWSAPIYFNEDDNLNDFLGYIEPTDSISRLYLDEDESVTREQAFASMLIGSANNAAQALAKTTAPSFKEFVAVMNSLSKEWGLKHSQFVEPSGLSLDNLSTAHDMALATCQSFRDPLTKKYAGYSYYKFVTSSGEEKRIQHTVHALRNDLDYEIFLGGKTGYLHETGFHVAAEIKTANGKIVCASVLSTASRQESEDTLLAMREWLDLMYR